MTEQELEIIRNRTEKECVQIRVKDCMKCDYGSNAKDPANVLCDYVLITGHARPCLAGECRETGVFVDKKRNMRRKVFKIKSMQEAER